MPVAGCAEECRQQEPGCKGTSYSDNEGRDHYQGDEQCLVEGKSAYYLAGVSVNKYRQRFALYLIVTNQQGIMA